MQPQGIELHARRKPESLRGREGAEWVGFAERES